MTINTEQLKELLANSTPGPWRVFGKNTGKIISENAPGIVEIGEIGSFLEPELVPFNAGRWNADARLIAIAPQLAADNIALQAEVERLRGLLWYSWSEFNSIRARSGAPLSHDGMLTTTEDWWDTMTEAFGEAIGVDSQTPWPSKEARSAINHKETDNGTS